MKYVKVVASRKMFGTVYRKKVDAEGRIFYTVEQETDKETYLQAERGYQRRVRK